MTDLHVSEVVDQPSEVLKEAIRQLHENRSLLPIIVALAGHSQGTKALEHKLGYTANLRKRLQVLIRMGLVVKSGHMYHLMAICPVLVAKAQEAVLGPSVAPPPEPKPAKPADINPGPAYTPPTQADKIALQFKVPARRNGAEAQMGGVMPCVTCQKPTPLKYGLVPTCYKCARA